METVATCMEFSWIRMDDNVMFPLSCGYSAVAPWVNLALAYACKLCFPVPFIERF